MTSTQPVDFNGETLFLVEGKLNELQRARTKVNLLAQIEQNLQAKSLVGGTLAAAAGMHNLVANAAMLALYDGEDMMNFAGVLGDQVVCGVFEHAGELADGDHVRAVVSRRADVLFVHSLMRTSDHLLMMPLNTFAGKRALLHKSIRYVCFGSLAIWLVMAAFFGWNLVQEESFSAVQIDNLKFGAVVAFIAPLAVMLFTEVPTYRDMRYFGQYASAIFTVYGFPKPDSLNVLKGMTEFPGGAHGFYAVSAKLALAKHGARLDD